MTVHIVPFGPPAFHALWRAIMDAKDGDPLAPVTVAVPSNYAGLSLRRSMGFGEYRWQQSHRDGLVNVRFLALPRVAEFLGAPRLAGAGRRPLTRAVAGEAVRAALAPDPGLLAGVAGHPSTERSLARTFLELRHISDEALARLATQGKRPALIVRLYREYRRLTHDYYDEEDLAEAAWYAVELGAVALRDLGHIILFLPRSLSPAEQSLVEALEHRGALTLLLGSSGDSQADALLPSAVGTIYQRATPVAASSEALSTTLLVSTPDPEEEVRTALRLALSRREHGTPLHRMALLYPAAEPYALLAHSVFSAANVPHNGPSVRTLAQTVTGRFLLGLLKVPAHDFRRADVMDWLTACPVRETRGGRLAPAQRWDALSRTAGVVQGEPQWGLRLKVLDAELQASSDARRDGQEGSEWRLRRLQLERAEAKALTRFMEELFTSFKGPLQPTWPSYARWARDLTERYLGAEPQLGSWPEEELRAYQTIISVLQELSDLDAVRQNTEEGTFLRALERELEAPAGRIGSFGQGMFIGRVQDALGTAFDTVFVLGLNEGLMPARGREDPLLPDRERLAVGAEAPLRGNRVAEERRDYLAALAAAPERVLVFSRADPRAQQSRLPSRWLLDAAARLEGQPMYSADLERLPRRPWFIVAPSFEGALLNEQLPPASEQEYDLRSFLQWRLAGNRPTAHYRVQEVDGLRRGLDALQARRSSAFTSWDGRVAPVSPILGPQQALSPTSLQNWAACPFRYYLAHALGVAETQRPEDILSISALERGTLVHGAFDRFIRRAPPRTSPEQPWTEDERRLLDAIGQELCDEAAHKGLTGKPLLWKLRRGDIARDLAGFLDHDEALRRELGVVPHDSELAFGLHGKPPASLELPTGRRVLFRGVIDRLDVSPDGRRAVVLDYKTGSPGWYRDLERTTIGGGKFLQLPIYALAANAEHPGAAVEAYYWFVSEQAEYKRLGYSVDKEHMAVFTEAMEVILGGIEGGVFVARPGARGQEGMYENCRFCPFDRICPADREAVWQRKRLAPELAPYVALAEA